MHEENIDGQASHERQVIALTPRPVRLLIVGRIKPGAETKLRETQAQFPHDAANEAGIDAIEAFIGSGQYAVQFEIGREDIQHVLATFFNDARVRTFRASLESIVEGLPSGDYQFGAADRTHSAGEGASEAAARTIYNTGDLPFAASMYRWRVGEPPQTGQVPHGRAGS
ncbi:MAG: hypothetical protein ACRDJC_23100 [Thermomicrobiales bacterium]